MCVMTNSYSGFAILGKDEVLSSILSDGTTILLIAQRFSAFGARTRPPRLERYGGRTGIRTPDPLIKSLRALSFPVITSVNKAKNSAVVLVAELPEVNITWYRGGT